MKLYRCCATFDRTSDYFIFASNKKEAILILTTLVVDPHNYTTSVVKAELGSYIETEYGSTIVGKLTKVKVNV